MKLQNIIEIIEQNQSKISAYGKFEEAALKKINYKIRLDWNYYSNQMEGGTLTKEETRSVMVGNIDVSGKPFKDVAEMNGHDQVVVEVLKMSKGQVKISEKRVKEIHKAIMYEESPEKSKEIGNWKSLPNEIINYKGEKYAFTSPEEVSTAIHQLIDKTNAQIDRYNQKKETPHPIEIAAQFHIGYVNIHPFYDGNGRTARILTNILLMSLGLPPIIIKDEHKRQYHQLLGDIQAYGGSPDLFYVFVGQRVIDTQQLMLDVLEGKEVDDDEIIDKRIALLNRRLQAKDNFVQEKRTQNTLSQVLQNVVLPLLENAIENAQKLSPQFIETEFSFHLNGKETKYLPQEEILPQIKKSWEFQGDDIDNWQFSVNYKTFKALGTQTFHLKKDIRFAFHTHKYQIHFDEILHEFLYHQFPAEKEIKAYVTALMSQILDEIDMYLADFK